MIVHVEYLYHYTCDHCEQKIAWTIADRVPQRGVELACPVCYQVSRVDDLQTHALEPIMKPKQVENDSKTILDRLLD